MTSICCHSTARDAAMMDYKVFFVSDANAAISDELHNATLLNIVYLFADVRSTKQSLTLLT
ncbi:MAG: isochorismatase family protein [Proteobacteria bacterium]|nr:isochorismatase family protein [Pseudomonadota bacterium]